MTTELVSTPWAHPRNMFEDMARYQALYGLKPVGPHRRLADTLLKDITCKCTTCKGTGLYGTYGGMGWRSCPACHGLGVVYTIGLDKLEELRGRVLDQYPDAGPQHWRPYVPIRCPVQNLQSGEMLDAALPLDFEPVQEELPF